MIQSIVCFIEEFYSDPHIGLFPVHARYGSLFRKNLLSYLESTCRAEVPQVLLDVHLKAYALHDHFYFRGLYFTPTDVVFIKISERLDFVGWNLWPAGLLLSFLLFHQPLLFSSTFSSSDSAGMMVELGAGN